MEGTDQSQQRTDRTGRRKSRRDTGQTAKIVEKCTDGRRVAKSTWCRKLDCGVFALLKITEIRYKAFAF